MGSNPTHSTKLTLNNIILRDGVIGNTVDFGPAITGSSPVPATPHFEPIAPFQSRFVSLKAVGLV